MSRKVINIVGNLSKGKDIKFAGISSEQSDIVQFTNTNVEYPEGVTFEWIQKQNKLNLFVNDYPACTLHFVGVTESLGVEGYVFVGASLASLKTYLFTFTADTIIYVSR